MSRLVRETLSFSKKLAHHIGAIKYFVCHDNLMRVTAAALPAGIVNLLLRLAQYDILRS